MSNVYGYPRIKFYTNDGTADADAAKRAYDWCKANYDWFKGDEEDGSKAPFLLEGNEFVPNAAVGLDGNALDLKDGSIPSDVDWLGEPCRQTKAARLIASLYEDGSESSYDSNSYVEKVWIDGKEKDRYSLRSFNTSMHPCYQQDSSLLMHYDDEESYRELQGVFKNTKTGEKVLAGKLVSKLDYDLNIDEDGEFCGDVDDLEQSLVFYEADEFVSPKDKDACVKAFVADLKEDLGEDAQISESDWTFVGLGSERSFFDIYGTNPPLKQYRSAWDFYDNE